MRDVLEALWGLLVVFTIGTILAIVIVGGIFLMTGDVPHVVERYVPFLYYLPCYLLPAIAWTSWSIIMFGGDLSAGRTWSEGWGLAFFHMFMAPILILIGGILSLFCLTYAPNATGIALMINVLSFLAMMNR